MDFSMCIIYGDDPGEYAGEGTKNSEIVLLTANVASGGSVTGGAATIEPTAEPKRNCYGNTIFRLVEVLWTEAYIYQRCALRSIR